MGVDVAEAVAVGDGFLHRALLYRGAAEFRASIERCLRGGQARAAADGEMETVNARAHFLRHAANVRA